MTGRDWGMDMRKLGRKRRREHSGKGQIIEGEGYRPVYSQLIAPHMQLPVVMFANAR